MNSTNKTEYPALLASLQPSDAVTVLNSRVKQIHAINSDIADWLAERRRVEQEYVRNLNRLAARTFDSGVELGVFQTPWQSIVAGTVSLAEAHANLASRIESDVESPLKDQRRDLQSMSSMQANLTAMAKDVDRNKKKSGSGAESAASQWESQAPYIFEQLQGLDENRINQMREALTQLQTHEIDCHERSKSSAEAGLNALLNVDTPEEISAFVARTSSQIPLATPTDEVPRPDTSSRRGTVSRATREGSRNALAPPVPAPRRRESEDRRSETSEPTEEAKAEKKSRLSGLKRLGTVMSRRKDKDKDKDKEKETDTGRSPRIGRRNPLRRESSAVMQPIPSPGASTSDLPSTAAPEQTSREPDRLVSLQDLPTTNGHATTSPPATTAPSTLDPAPDAATDSPIANGSLAPVNIPQIGIRPPSTILEEGATSSMLADIERAQQEANAQEPDNAFNLNIRDKPIEEESTETQNAAMANVSNALRASQLPPPQRRTGTVRGRRDVRNTMFVPNPTVETATAGEPIPVVASPISGITGSPVISSPEQRGADSQSIRSSHSMASISPGAVRHPEMLNPGLNASIIETSNVTFSNGIVTKATVLGELAMIHNGSPTSLVPPSIRLEHFPVLEKVAPNPAFVEQLPGRSGEYTLNISQLSRTAVAFKYQVHLSDSALGAYAPIVIHPIYRIEANQTSVILNYGLNPAYAPPVSVPGPVTLHNVVIILTLEGAKATSCQSKPAGVFSKEKSLIYWKLNEVTLAQDTTQKLLARFATEGEANAGSVEARWEAKGAGSGLGVSLLGEGGASAASGGADPFADASTSSTSLVHAREVEVLRKMVTGKYLTASD